MPATSALATTVWERPGATGHAVLLPGFLDGREDPAVAALGAALHAVGLDAVAVDPRGTGQSAGTPADLGPTTQLADIAALVEPADRVVLIGHCYGALLACLAAAADPRITDVVALMPSRCFIWPEDYDPTLDTWRAAGERTFLRGDRAISVPHSVVQDALRHDLPAALATVRQRILFVAGERDRLIGVEPVRRLHAECGSPHKQLAVLPVQHDFRDLPDQIETVVGAVLQWLSLSG